MSKVAAEKANPIDALELLGQVDLAALDAEIESLTQRIERLRFLRRNVAVAQGAEPARKKPTPRKKRSEVIAEQAAAEDEQHAQKISLYLRAAGKSPVNLIAGDTGLHHRTVDRICREFSTKFRLTADGLWSLAK